MKTTCLAFALVTMGLAFSMNASAETLKMPLMTDTQADVSIEVEQAVRKDEASGTTSTSLSAVGAKTPKFNVNFFSANAVVAGAGTYKTFFSQNDLNLQYNLDKNRSVQVRQDFLYNMTNQDYPYEWTLGDTGLQYMDTGKKLGKADTVMIARLYLPTSYWNAQVGKYELRLYGMATQHFNKYLDITYMLNPRFYTYSVNNAAQTSLQMVPGITATYASSSAFLQPFTMVYTQSLWGNTGKGVGLLYNDVAGVSAYQPVNQDLINLDFGTNINISKTVSATAFYEYTNNLHDNSYQDIDNSNSSWNLWFSASM